VSGREVARKTGTGGIRHEFDTSRLSQGIYLLRLKAGTSSPVIRKYLVSARH
jgi:hypothetical protein